MIRTFLVLAFISLVSVVTPSAVQMPEYTSAAPKTADVSAKTKTKTKKQTSGVQSEAKAEILLAQSFTQDIPVGDVQEYLVDDAAATAILIPQVHRHPVVGVLDNQNDRAVAMQKEAYGILKKIVTETNVEFIMVEGELEGTVDEEKKTLLQKKMAVYEQMKTAYETLAGQTSGVATVRSSPAALDPVLKETKDLLAYLERDIMLTGAPFLLWSEGGHVTLLGAENAETQEHSREIVRERVYIEDRIKQLSGTPQLSSFLRSRAGTSIDLSEVLKKELMKKLNAARTNEPSGAAAETLSLSDLSAQTQMLAERHSGTQEQTAEQALLALSEAFAELDALNKKVVQQKANTASAAPSRTDNPFRSITDVARLKKMLKENEAQINRVILDRRNVETAQNFAEAMKSRNASAGIIQYGAQHTQGLVKALQEEGISVIVVTPNTVQLAHDSQNS